MAVTTLDMKTDEDEGHSSVVALLSSVVNCLSPSAGYMFMISAPHMLGVRPWLRDQTNSLRA